MLYITYFMIFYFFFGICESKAADNLVSKKVLLTSFYFCFDIELTTYIQVNLIIMLSLGSMETDHVISEQCYNEVIYNRYITK